ncbi:glycosyl hydrolase BNR repeat-containing protein [Haloterrigena salina JCM 13891]|uniref:Glycosyl hydrolase BNR repeat-containing protein n=1 Tax=Haloterrigena salina JCM 13891 TaxID=1227488 RepID=M0C0M4_9EURY|nr:sialidase family protein [Haloterrigena salina]ELZ15464.1 glycosyl hydrolase BNR repeat-containing protein [Haloterrigena salina JCM 13891]
MTTDGDRTENALYTPPPDAPGAGAMYPRVVRLDCDGAEGETLLATFEQYGTGDDESGQPYFPLYRSEDGGRTWSRFSAIRDTQNGWGLRFQPTLFELPESIGPWSAGTILAAGNAIPEDRSRTKIDVYASEDGGRNWSYVSTVATGGKAVPRVGATPVWEPEFAIDADGDLVCYFADERHREEGYNQLVGHRVSGDGGRTWGEETFDAAIPDGEQRPGMPVVTKLPDGRYAMVFEIVGPEYGGGIFLKTSPDGRDWGDPADIGSPVRTEEGYQLTNGPYITWTPAGGDEGTVLVSGKTLRDSDGNQAPGSGRTLLATTDFSEFDSWEAVSAPLRFEDAIDVGHETVGWTTPLLPSPDGDRLLQLTSTSVEGEHCEISYAAESLEL